MTEKAFTHHLDKLLAELMQHPHKEELIELAMEQLSDDTLVLDAQVI